MDRITAMVQAESEHERREPSLLAAKDCLRNSFATTTSSSRGRTDMRTNSRGHSLRSTTIQQSLAGCHTTIGPDELNYHDIFIRKNKQPTKLFLLANSRLALDDDANQYRRASNQQVTVRETFKLIRSSGAATCCTGRRKYSQRPIRPTGQHNRTTISLLSYLLVACWLATTVRLIECDQPLSGRELSQTATLGRPAAAESTASQPSSVPIVSVYPTTEMGKQTRPMDDANKLPVSPSTASTHRTSLTEQTNSGSVGGEQRHSPVSGGGIEAMTQSVHSTGPTLNLANQYAKRRSDAALSTTTTVRNEPRRLALPNTGQLKAQSSTMPIKKLAAESSNNNKKKLDRLGSEFVNPDYDSGFDVDNSINNNNNNEHQQPSRTEELTELAAESSSGHNKQRYDLAADTDQQQQQHEDQEQRFTQLSPTSNGRQQVAATTASSGKTTTTATRLHSSSSPVDSASASSQTVPPPPPPPPSTSASLMAPSRWSMPEDEFNNFSPDESHATPDDVEDINLGGEDGGQSSRRLNWNMLGNTSTNPSAGGASQWTANSSNSSNTISSNGHQNKRQLESTSVASSAATVIGSEGHLSEGGRQQASGGGGGGDGRISGASRIISADWPPLASSPKSSVVAVAAALRRGGSSDRTINARENKSNPPPSSGSKFSTLLSSRPDSSQSTGGDNDGASSNLMIARRHNQPSEAASVDHYHHYDGPSSSAKLKLEPATKTTSSGNGRSSGFIAGKLGQAPLKAPVHARARLRSGTNTPGSATDRQQDRTGRKDSTLASAKSTVERHNSIRDRAREREEKSNDEISLAMMSQPEASRASGAGADNSLEIFSHQFKYTASKARKPAPNGSRRPTTSEHDDDADDANDHGRKTKRNLKDADAQSRSHNSQKDHSNSRKGMPLSQANSDHEYIDQHHLNGRLVEEPKEDERRRSPPRVDALKSVTRGQPTVAVDEPGRRSARTITTNKTSNNLAGVAKANVRYAVYDLTEEHSGTKTSEHRSNYTLSTVGQNYTSKASIDHHQRQTQDPRNGTAAIVAQRNGTESMASTLKTATKRRDAWDKLGQVGANNGSPPVQKLNGATLVAPLVTLHMANSKSSLTSNIFNRIQPKQDSSSHHFFKDPHTHGLNASNSLNYNNIQQQRDSRSASSQQEQDRASIVRSGFIMPTMPIHSPQALAPATMALLAHASSTRPGSGMSSPFESGHLHPSQMQALSQLRTLLINHHQQQQQQQHLTGVENLLASTSSPEYQAVGSQPQKAGSLATDASQSNFQPQQQPPIDQMMATANHLGVSHIGPHHQMVHSDPASMSGFNSAASLQDYSLDMPASAPVSSQRDTRGGGGGDISGPLSGGIGPQDVQNNEQQRSEQARGQSNLNSNGLDQDQQQQQQQQPLRGSASTNNNNNNNNNNYSPEYSQPAPNVGPASQSDGGNQGGFNAYYEPGRNSSPSPSSSSMTTGNSNDYYGPLTRSSSNYYIRPEHKGGGGNGAESMMPTSLRSSLDPFEETSGSPMSTSEFERDLADLDDEFNRHAIFNRHSRPASYPSAGSASLMSDSMLSYSPDRYENIRYHHHHHHHQPYSRRPQALIHTYEPSYGASASTGGVVGGHTMSHISPSATSTSSGLSSGGDYLNAAGSISNIIPRPYQHQHNYHNQRTAASSIWPSASSPSYSSAPSGDSDVWLTDSSYDFSPLASFLASPASTKWRPPRYHQVHYQQQQPPPPLPTTNSRSYPSPYLTLAPAASYLSTSASEQPPAGYNLVPSYASAASSVAAASNSAGPETVSFTISPLAAAAAAAATALAAADKTRHHHHHGHHSWTFTLPRVASALASQASAQLASPATSSGHTPTMTASAPLQYATATTSTGQYRPATAGSYLFSPMPIYAIATRPAPTANQLSSSASAATPSIVPIHTFHPTPGSGAAGAAGMIAYRPTSIFASAPMLTSFAYPVRLPIAAPTAYYPHHPHHGLAAGSSDHHLHHYSSRPSSGRTVSAGSSLKPFYADLQFAESKPKLNNNNHNNNGQQSGNSAASSTKNLVKTTAGGLTQIARNLTKKVFGSASQMRPQFAAPPANFEPIVSAAPSTASLSPSSSLSSSSLSDRLAGAGIQVSSAGSTTSYGSVQRNSPPVQPIQATSSSLAPP